MTQPVIETNTLTKQYNDTIGIKNLDLVVKSGQVYGLLGPNGAGKSTIISLLSGYIHPNKGTARILDYDPWNNPVELHQRIGIVPDNVDIYKNLSARRHLSLAIETNGSGEDPIDLLEAVGLEAVADATAGEFSQGMKQRLVLAIALVNSPDILLLDEPFTGLDPHGVALIRKLITQKSNNGKTVLISSHRLNHIESLCDQLGVIYRGTVVREGAPENLRKSLELSEEATLEDLVLELTGADIRMSGVS